MIFDVNEKNLKGFTTTEIDKKRGQDKFPPIEFRNRTSDLLEEEIVKPTGKGDRIDYDEGKAIRDQ